MIKAKRVMSATEKALREQNAQLRDIIKTIHARSREQSAFITGILICELIDNPSENRAYDKAIMLLGQGVEEISRLATQDLVGK